MPRNGSGTYTLPTPENPVVADTVIDPDDHNTTMDDIATALTGSLTKNGEAVASANQPMGGFKHTGAGEASASGQYLVYGQDLPVLNNTDRVDVASVAGTTALEGAAVTSNYIRITGTNAITALTLDDGRWRHVVAGGAFSLTAGASLLIEGQASGTVVTLASGQTFTVHGESGGVVRVRGLTGAYRIDAVTATTEVVSTAAETTVYTKSIAGGTLGIDRALRLTIIGDLLQNNGTQDITFRCKFGGTTIGASTHSSIVGSASRKTFKLVLDIHAKAATNAQVAAFTTWLDLTTASGSGAGPSAVSHSATMSGHNALAIDSTAAQTLLVTAQHGASSSNESFKMLSARLELIQ